MTPRAFGPVMNEEADRLQHRRLAAILAADVVGYSRLMAADEAGTHVRLSALRKDVVEPRIAAHHGRIVKLMGDGLLAEFASVVDAVECAAAIQQGVAERQADVPDEQRLALRIGINIGDVIIEGDDIYGDGVNVAARLEALAEPGIAEIRRGLELQRRSPVGLRRPYYLSVLADALARSGNDREALAAVEEGLARRQRADDRNWAPELHRLRGELLRRNRGPHDAEIEHCLGEALDAARRQGARSLELRAATNLARLWGEGGQRAEARDLLAPVYGWFTEGLDTADLEEAKTLLDELQ